MDPAITIRPVGEGDYPVIQPMLEAEFQFHAQARPDYFFVHQENSYPRTEFRDHLALPCPISWLAEWEGRPAGVCLGRIRTHPEDSANFRPRTVAEIEDLYTLPEYRGRGIAGALLDRAAAQAKAAGAGGIELCVWGFNTAAQRLYERLGFTAQYSRLEKRF